MTFGIVLHIFATISLITTVLYLLYLYFKGLFSGKDDNFNLLVKITELDIRIHTLEEELKDFHIRTNTLEKELKDLRLNLKD